MTEKQPADAGRAARQRLPIERILGRAQGHRAARARRRHRARRRGLRRDRPRGRRGLLQHRHDRLRGDPHRSLLCRADHHLHLPAHRQCRHQRGRHRDREHGGDAGRARRGAAHRHHRSRRTTAPRATSTNGSRRAASSVSPASTPARSPACIRVNGMPNAVIAHEPSGRFDLESLKQEARAMAGPRRHGSRADGDVGTALHLGRDAVGVGQGLRPAGRPEVPRGRHRLRHQAQHPAPARRQRLQGDGGAGADLEPRTSSRSSPTAFSSPTARATRRRPANMRCRSSASIIDSGIPTFGICLGHQMLGIAVGAKTTKMHQGHHGANHPVKDLVTGKVEITSMNHGFAVDRATLPANVDRNACVAVRRLELRHRAQGQAGVLGAVPSGSIARPARQPLSVRAFHRDDAATEAAVKSRRLQRRPLLRRAFFRTSLGNDGRSGESLFRAAGCNFGSSSIGDRGVAR